MKTQHGFRADKLISELDDTSREAMVYGEIENWEKDKVEELRDWLNALLC